MSTKLLPPDTARAALLNYIAEIEKIGGAFLMTRAVRRAPRSRHRRALHPAPSQTIGRVPGTAEPSHCRRPRGNRRAALPHPPRQPRGDRAVNHRHHRGPVSILPPTWWGGGNRPAQQSPIRNPEVTPMPQPHDEGQVQVRCGQGVGKSILREAESIITRLYVLIPP